MPQEVSGPTSTINYFGMKIFLTGATGFIGKNLLKSLIGEGHEVLALCRRESNSGQLEKIGAKVLQKDLQDIKEQDLGDTEAIFHLAAIRYEWGHLPKDYEEVNVETTKNLLKIAEKTKIKKFIYGSSVFVFGYPRRIPIDETFSYAPTTEYARSKMKAERTVKKYSDECGLQTVIIRPTMTYGPEDTKGMLLKLAKLIKNKKFAIIGNGLNFIHLTHIDDVVRGFQKALQTEIKSDDFIIASKKAVSQKDLIDLVAKELNVKIWPIRIPHWLAISVGYANETIYKLGMRLKIGYFFKEPFISRSKVDIISQSQIFSAEKAKKILGFEAKVDPEAGIRDTINWYRENKYV